MVTAALANTHASTGFNIVNVSSGEKYDGFYAFQTVNRTLPKYPIYEGRISGAPDSLNLWVEKFKDAAGKPLFVAFAPVQIYYPNPDKPTPREYKYIEPQNLLLKITPNTQVFITCSSGATSTSYSDGNGDISLEIYKEPVFIEEGYENHPPVLNPIGNKQVEVGSLLTFTITATDPDNDPLTYTATNLPQGATFASQTFNWLPSQTGTYTVCFEVSDGSLKDTETITIIVQEKVVIEGEDSPFGFLDPPLGNPGTNNYDYYQDLGTKWLEFPRENTTLGWQSMETQTGTYNFSKADTELSNHYQQGLNVVWVTRPVNSLYGTSWIEGNGQIEDEYPDGHLNEWFNYMKKVAERYDGDGIDDAPSSQPIIINYYQFVHELAPLFAVATDDYWQNHTDQYAEVFELTYRAIKEANPNAVLSMNVGEPLKGSNFISDVLFCLKGSGTTDIGFDYHSWSDYKERISFIKKIKEIASNYGWDPEKIKIFGNESGYPDAAGTKEREQALYVVPAYTVSLANGQTKMFWTRVFDYINSSEIWGHIGLIHNPANPDQLSHKKLAYYTYKLMVEKLEGSDWDNIGIISEGQDNLYAYKFTNKETGKPIWVAWNDSTETKTFALNVGDLKYVKITETIPDAESGTQTSETDYPNFFGTETKAVTNGMLDLTLGIKPVFIEKGAETLLPKVTITKRCRNITKKGTDTDYLDLEKALIGDVIEFRILVENIGPGTATDVSVVDNIPDGLFYEAGSIIGPGAEVFDSKLKWVIPIIPPCGSETLSFKAKVE
jgi:uncharacterized repeat protein (TIGR01451 family)